MTPPTPPKSTPPTLPPNLITKILLRSNSKSLARFSCVCKSWYALIRNPIFINKWTQTLLIRHPNMPPDLLGETFHRLSVHFLLRCRSFSKSVCELLDDPNFIKQHLEFNRVTDSVLICQCLRIIALLRVQKPPEHVLDNRHLDEVRCPDLTKINFHDFSEFMLLAGSVDGVVCLSHKREFAKSVVALWNPAVKMWKPVLLPQSKYKSWCDMSVGLGFDAVENDFKIICMVPVFSGWSRIEIFSNNHEVWAAETVVPFSVLGAFNCKFVVKGNPYWIGIDGRNPDSRVLGRVDSSGLFRSFRFPDPDSNVFNWKDSVAASVCSPDQIFIDFYVLDENMDNWTKYYRVGISKWDRIEIVQCMSTGELVMMFWNDLPLDFGYIFIDPETGSTTSTSELESIAPVWPQSYSHVQSLICPKGMVDIGMSDKKKFVLKKRLEWLAEDFESVLRGE